MNGAGRKSETVVRGKTRNLLRRTRRSSGHGAPWIHSLQQPHRLKEIEIVAPLEKGLF
jgi:hypothetical protein